MCGIAGFIGFRDDNLIKQFSRELAHRGPDGEGYYCDSNISLLSRRLAIIDRSGGDQPIYNEDKSVVVVYNGEIYNYQELRAELEKHGHRFTTYSDTEVIVHGYEEWGDEAFERYNGMFGVALYDIRKSRLLLARDHFGIKPLYYCFLHSKNEIRKAKEIYHSEKNAAENTKHMHHSVENKNQQEDRSSRLIFSSELKPIVQSGLIQPAVNERTLYRYLRYRIHEDETDTFFAGIQRLLPGEMLVWEQGEMYKKMYTSLQKDILHSINIKQKKAVDQILINDFKELLIDSVKRRLVSEVPVGTCLSGGLDSSVIAGIVNKLIQEKSSESKSVGVKQNTFSAVFPGSSNNEEQYVDAMISAMKEVNSHKIYPKPDEFIDDLIDFIRTQEEPTISTGPYAQYQVMKHAHKQVTVLLDGQGSDEMMAGYLPYYFVFIRQLWSRRAFATLAKEIWNGRDILYHFIKKRITSGAGRKKDSASELLSDEFKKRHQYVRFYAESQSLRKRLFDDIFRHSLQSLLRYEDRNSMRFGIEGRVPFLDVRLVRFLFTLPDEAIIKSGWNKYILRAAAKQLVPELIRKRRNKIGFTTPEEEWMQRLRKEIGIILSSDRFASRPYFNHKNALEMYRRFIQGDFHDTLLLWRMINVELWLREFIDVKPQRENVNHRNENEKDREQYVALSTGSSIEVDNKQRTRFLIRTDVFASGDEYPEKIAESLLKIRDQIEQHNIHHDKAWYLVVSEKIVAISQGRSRFIWDIRATWLATILSRYVTRTSAGIGLGSPWTMQLALEEAGIVRILIATLCSLFGKIIGMKGLFYRVAGHGVNAIDGPTSYSLFPSNVSAKLPPQDPQHAAELIDKAVRQKLSTSVVQYVRSSASQSKKSSDQQLHNSKDGLMNSAFRGVVILDANDIGRNVLGNTTDKPDDFFEKSMRDNPMGQSREQTPLCIIM